MLLFKRILDFQKTDGGFLDKRGAKRYPVGAKFPLKPKITLSARDGQGNILPAGKGSSMDWGGQLVNLSTSGLSIRLHPAALASAGEKCNLKLELGHMIFELQSTVAYYRTGSQYVTVGLIMNFSDAYAEKAYQQLMEPVVIGSTFEGVAPGKVKQDIPGLQKEQYQGESNSMLSLWRDSSGKHPKLFELLVHDYVIRGNTENPGLNIGFRDDTKGGRRASRPAVEVAMSKEHQTEVQQLFRFIVQNLTKSVTSDTRKFLELFAV